MNALRRYTPARVALGRVGNSLPTRELLEFQLAHARARDAVHAPFDPRALLLEIEAHGWAGLLASSAAADRATYLRRPDLGRTLHLDSSERLRARHGEFDAVFILADGLSALAVHRHAVTLLERTFVLLAGEWSVAPVVVVEQGRVAIGDAIGSLLGANLAVVLIGERPGLSSPDSLGVYLTWNPRPGRNDAERNCISNVRAEGLSYEVAARRLVFLMNESRRRKLTGVALKEADPLVLPAPGGCTV
jgi:ethanolamine ammonia-lyase small subunit